METVSVVAQPEQVVVGLGSEPKTIDGFAALRASIRGEKQPEPKAPEAEKVAAATPEPELAPGEITQEAKTETEAIPPSVQKRLDKEAARQKELTEKITSARSATKAKEAELKEIEQNSAALNGKQGTEPVKTGLTSDGRPSRPNLDTFEGTVAEYNTAVAKYETDYEEWLTKSLTEKLKPAIADELKAGEAKKRVDAEWAQAVKDHGAEFPTHVAKVREATSEGMQHAIGALEDWPRLAVHLGQNPEELHKLSDLFEENPPRAMAELGKLQERLKPVASATAATPEKPERKLPEPAKPVGGSAAPSSDTEFGKLEYAEKKARMRKQGFTV